jgi:dATP pyrophosphohydrolase
VANVSFKIPESVLVVIYTPELQTLLLERADHPGFWQSVTGSLADPQEPLTAACAREVEEETGWRAPAIDFRNWDIEHTYAIFPQWRHRYAPGVTHNREHVFGLCVAQPYVARLAPREHTRSRWLGWREAGDACFSWTNAQAIRSLAPRPCAASLTPDPSAVPKRGGGEPIGSSSRGAGEGQDEGRERGRG